jgi:glyoxylase-like metal-dependent hydrolase (beta-lactamase superfamily II)
LNWPVLDALADDVRRITFPLPTRPGHVHGYLLRGDDGWMLVDTGLELPDAGERIAAAARELGAPIVRVLVTHFHPDHVGASQTASEVTGADVWQGILDYEQCAHVWGNPEWPARIAAWFVRNGVPQQVADELILLGNRYGDFIRYRRDPHPLRAGETIGGWEVLELPGHADGHVAFARDGALVAGDHVLERISPAVGLYPDSRPDPLGNYLASLRHTVERGFAIAYPGHGEPLENPARRASELLEHHRLRLDETERLLVDAGAPCTGYEASMGLFGTDLAPTARRFAVAETLSHLERLVAERRAGRAEDSGIVSYTPM